MTRSRRPGYSWRGSVSRPSNSWPQGRLRGLCRRSGTMSLRCRPPCLPAPRALTRPIGGGSSRRGVSVAWTRSPRLEINRLAEQAKDQVTLRRNARDGRSATEHLIAALRCLYRHAVDDGLISASANPAVRVAKPRRLASTRHALSADRLAEIVAAATSTGNDPDLDGLILRLHIETACRRGGALALRPADLDRAQCLVRLREKGGTVRWQPVSPTLAQRLADHAQERLATPDMPLLRYRSGRRSPRAATTICGSVSDNRCRGCRHSRCPRIGCGTPR